MNIVGTSAVRHGGHLERSVGTSVNLVSLFMFHEKLLVWILVKKKVIRFLYRLLLLRALCFKSGVKGLCGVRFVWVFMALCERKRGADEEKT